MRAPQTLSVSQALELLRTSLARGFPSLCVVGEVVDPFLSGNGHFYLRLRDSGGEVKVVMWRREAQNLRSFPKVGDRVLVRGSFTVFSGKGELQLQASGIAKEGQGEKHAQLAALKEKLRAEGLFDRPRRELPFLPRRLGVVTSASSAVLHDIFQSVRRRNPSVEIWLSPSAVSGPEAPRELVKALGRLRGRVDAVIIARGGGSFEELLAFSDEGLVRAVLDFPVAILSAIGHGSDSTLLDLVADGTAATPTAAAELATPLRDDLLAAHRVLWQRAHKAVSNLVAADRRELLTLARLCQSHRPHAVLVRRRSSWQKLSGELVAALHSRLVRARHDGQGLAARLALAPALLGARVQRLRREQSDLERRLLRAQAAFLQRERKGLAVLRRQALQLGPGAVLARGFAMVMAAGEPVTTVAGRREGEELELLLADGTITVTVRSVSAQPHSQESFVP